MVIIGLLSAMAAPKFIQITGENQLDGDANTLFQDLLWMRTAAITKDSNFVLTIKDTTRGGSPCVVWRIHEIIRTSTAYKTVLRKEFFAGVSVTLSKGDGIPSPTAAEFSNLQTYASGFQDANTSVVQRCAQPIPGGLTTKTAEAWSDGITACPTAAGDMETGAVYLHSSRSDVMSFAIVFDRSKFMAPQLFRHTLAGWEKQ
ncbi:MAG: hypothetical protein RL318_2133 [Fibrobacterota bacterium]